VAPLVTYPLPQFLVGLISLLRYNAWIQERASTLYHRDLRRKRPCAINGSIAQYRDAIHASVMAAGLTDPFTGDDLLWELIETWDPKKPISHDDFVKSYCWMPTVDHKDPHATTVEFEICSWQVNNCKNDQSVEEFLEMCGTVAGRGKQRLPLPPTRSPKVFYLPDFLNNICTEDLYEAWLDKRAEELYVRDRDQKRPYGLAGSKAMYKRAIHAAVILAGLYDPFTGQRMGWELIKTWDTAKKAGDPFAEYEKYFLLPTVDHCDPYGQKLDLEICSWRINACKGDLTPEEFIGLCRKISQRRAAAKRDKGEPFGLHARH
jgi:hypothetical protein